MKPQTIVKIAHRTRKYSRFENPFAYRLARMVLKKIYPVQPPERALKMVTEYRQGLMYVDTMYSAERDILFFGSIEPGITKLIERLVKPGDVCLDIGANIGALTLLMAFLAGPEGMVVAVEPHPEMAARLRLNVNLNRLEHVSIIPAALSNTTGKTVLYAKQSSHYHQGGSSLQPSHALDQKIEIDTIRGSEVKDRIGEKGCKLIKIDVEGHDFIVLKELTDIIVAYRPFIVLEYESSRWREHKCRVEQVTDLLSDSEYAYFYMKKDIMYPLESHFPSACDIVCIPNSQ